MSHHFTSSLEWNRSLSFAFLIAYWYKWFDFCLSFIELLLNSFLRNLIFKRLDLIELAYGVCVQCIDTSECFITDRLLMICKKKTTELRSLEEIFTVVLWPCHRKNFYPLRCFINFWSCISCLERNISIWEQFDRLLSVFYHFVSSRRSFCSHSIQSSSSLSSIWKQRVVEVLNHTSICNLFVLFFRSHTIINLSVRWRLHGAWISNNTTSILFIDRSLLRYHRPIRLILDSYLNCLFNFIIMFQSKLVSCSCSLLLYLTLSIIFILFFF